MTGAVTAREATRRRWRRVVEELRLSDRGSSAVSIVAVLVAVGVGYHYSLMSLARMLKLETPLAYLGLVPFIALGLAIAKSRDASDEPDIHDRQLDLIVGVPMLVGALALLLVGPVRMSSLFWVWRVDLLSLPLFVAGVLTVVFGLRAMWRLRIAIAFLLLAWPLPYVRVMNGLLEQSAQLTIAGVKAALSVVPVASPMSGGDGSLFRVRHGSGSFVLSVASACSGVNGVLGFLLVGVAAVALVHGGRLRKLAWLGAGMVLLWAVNVVRILLIFGIGRLFGERTALDVLHPVLGLVTFGIGVVLMVLLLPRFGLRMAGPRRVPANTGVAPGGGDDGGRVRQATTTVGPKSLALVVAVTVLAGSANAGFRQYATIAHDSGEPRLGSYTEQPPRLPGWDMSLYDSFQTGKRFFGQKSTWVRLMYSTSSLAEAGPSLRAAAPVLVDVISTPNRQSLVDYGLEACYRFHGYKIRRSTRVDVGGGVVGTLISFYNHKDDRDWSTLHWEQPVRTFNNGVRYERVVFMMIDARKASLAPALVSPAPRSDIARSLARRIDNRIKGSGTDTVDAELEKVGEFLVGFGRAALQVQAGGAPGSAVS